MPPQHIRQYLNDETQDRPALLDSRFRFSFGGRDGDGPAFGDPWQSSCLPAIASFGLGQQLSVPKADGVLTG